MVFVGRFPYNTVMKQHDHLLCHGKFWRAYVVLVSSQIMAQSQKAHVEPNGETRHSH